MSGVGIVEAMPDTATIYAGATTERPTAAEAIEENGAAMARVLATLHAHGIAKVDVQTSGFAVSPVRKRDSHGRVLDAIRAYRVHNGL